MPKLIKFYYDSTAWFWLLTMSLSVVPNPVEYGLGRNIKQLGDSIHR
jgi:hypothetical protein